MTEGQRFTAELRRMCGIVKQEFGYDPKQFKLNLEQAVGEDPAEGGIDYVKSLLTPYGEQYGLRTNGTRLRRHEATSEDNVSILRLNNGIGTHPTYPGVKQTDDTCVFASIAGAINYLAGTVLTDDQFAARWKREGKPSPDFGRGRLYLQTEINAHGIQIEHFNDRDNPLPGVQYLLNALQSDKVAIVSVEVVTPVEDQYDLVAYHMLSMFERQHGVSQVWDSNGCHGTITDLELSQLVTGPSVLPIPYFDMPVKNRGTVPTVLAAHEVHDLLILSA